MKSNRKILSAFLLVLVAMFFIFDYTAQAKDLPSKAVKKKFEWRSVTKDFLKYNIPLGWQEYPSILEHTIILAPEDHEKVICGDGVPFYYLPSVNVTIYKNQRNLPMEVIYNAIKPAWGSLSDYELLDNRHVMDSDRDGYLTTFRYRRGPVNFISCHYLTGFTDSDKILNVEISFKADDYRNYSPDQLEKFLLNFNVE